MDLRTENRKRKEFREILFDLAKDEELQNNPVSSLIMCRRLEKLYSGDEFRHFYSDIFSVLTSIKQRDDRGNIQTLTSNLDFIRRDYSDHLRGHRGDISAKLQKLYDHVNLDVARIEYSEAGDKKVAGDEAIAEIKNRIDIMSVEIQRMTTDQTDVQRRITDAQKGYIMIQKQLEDSQKEYVTILGIFAAIVLAFTGGVAFSSSVLQNLHSVSIYRIVFVMMIIGIVLVNFLSLLLYYIDRLNNIERKRPWFPIVVSNLVFLLLIGLTWGAWLNGAVEARNERIQSPPAVVQQAENQSAPDSSK